MLNLTSLNPQQRMAVETINGPVLILAGAGTGKTRVITYRIAHMVQRGISPANVLAVTFTNKAAREMYERVRKLLPKPKKDAENGADTKPTICTFHSLCVRILRQHIDKLGYKRNFVIYDESEQLAAIKKILAQFNAKGEKLDPGSILAALSKLRNGSSTSPIYIAEEDRTWAELFRPRYESALRACNAVDFDDLILLTLRLFEDHSEALEACRAKYRYVMVDEYQDTNAAQFKLVHLLTSEHRNLCVVGDDDQSIYGWRGADISNLLDMEKYYPEVNVVKLEQNYRSTNTILDAANAVIQKNVRRRGKKLWSDKGAGAKISLNLFQTDDEEAREIVQLIEFARTTRRVPWSDQAILFRTNLQSRPIETALRKEQVRYHLIGGQSFFDRREIKDFIAYVKAFLNPHDEISLLRIANTPARGLADVTMERLLADSHERKCSVFSVMKNPVVTMTFQARTRAAIESFVALLEKYHHMLQRPEPLNLSTWGEHFLDEIGYFIELKRSEKDAEAAESRIRNIRELVASMGENSASGTSAAERLQTFLEDITLDTEREESDEAPDNAVTLITMHSCKGLEFPHVYVVGLEQGLLPHSRSELEGTLDEERRLFYVAITRARETLTLSHCASRKKFGKAVTCHPSIFLMDLPEELVEHANEKAKQAVTPAASKNMFAAMLDSIG